MRVLDFLGIAVPLLVAGVVLSFGVNSSLLPYTLTIAGVTATVQLVWTGWSLVATWRERLAYAREATTENMRFADQFTRLAQEGHPLSAELETELRLLDAANDKREDRDNQQDITEMERRQGLREALRQYKRPCAGCNVVPTLTPSSCDVCGTGGLK